MPLCDGNVAREKSFLKMYGMGDTHGGILHEAKYFAFLWLVFFSIVDYIAHYRTCFVNKDVYKAL